MIHPETVGTEETENADQEEDDVVPVSRIGHIVHVLQLGNLLVEHQDLYLREQCSQDTADRQPEIDGDVAAEPGCQRSAESVPYGDTEHDRPQDGPDDVDTGDLPRPILKTFLKASPLIYTEPRG